MLFDDRRPCYVERYVYQSKMEIASTVDAYLSQKGLSGAPNAEGIRKIENERYFLKNLGRQGSHLYRELQELFEGGPKPKKRR